MSFMSVLDRVVARAWPRDAGSAAPMQVGFIDCRLPHCKIFVAIIYCRVTRIQRQGMPCAYMRVCERRVVPHVPLGATPLRPGAPPLPIESGLLVRLISAGVTVRSATTAPCLRRLPHRSYATSFSGHAHFMFRLKRIR